MRDLTIGEFLTRLADRVPAPGGGAVAALHAAQSAALLGMVARYTTGEKYAAQQGKIERIIAATDTLRESAIELAAADAAAFTAVTDAYQLPKNTEAETAARSSAIASALVGAATPPAGVVEVAGKLVALAEELEPIGNRNVLSDVAAATDAARAAATTARVNIEINLAGIKDPAAKEKFAATADAVTEIARRADRVSDTVRAAIA